jgi:ATP-dependent DNA helicase RecQ
LKKVLSLGHDKLSVYGLGIHHSREAWAFVFHHLMARGLLEADKHGALKITDDGACFVKGTS